jgi:hypothetical protein
MVFEHGFYYGKHLKLCEGFTTPTLPKSSFYIPTNQGMQEILLKMPSLAQPYLCLRCTDTSGS